jgi:hypothetical protein
MYLKLEKLSFDFLDGEGIELFAFVRFLKTEKFNKALKFYVK